MFARAYLLFIACKNDDHLASELFLCQHLHNLVQDLQVHTHRRQVHLPFPFLLAGSFSRADGCSTRADGDDRQEDAGCLRMHLSSEKQGLPQAGLTSDMKTPPFLGLSLHSRIVPDASLETQRIPIG